MKSKATERKTDVYQSYVWKSFECEICKTPFPSSSPLSQHRIGNVSIRGQFYDIFTVSKPENNFLLLEILHKEKTSPRGFVILKFDARSTIKIVSLFIEIYDNVNKLIGKSK